MAQFPGLQGLGAPINYYDMIPDFRREALMETQNRLGQQQLVGQQMQNQQAMQENQRRDAFYNAISSATPDQLPALRRQFPEFVQNIQQEIGIQGSEHAAFVNGALNKLSVAASSGDPGQVQAAIQQNAPALASLGVSPDQASQLFQQNPQQFNSLLNATRMATMPIDKQFDVQQKQQQLEETTRSNKAGEAIQQRGQDITARGQNLSYQSAMTGHGISAQKLALDKQEFALKMQLAQQKADDLKTAVPKLTDATSKMIDSSISTAAASQNSANTMNTLADQLESQRPTAGMFGSMQNNIAKISGSDNYIRDLKIRRSQLASSQAVKNLPPGPASDKDIQFAREGIPDDKDSPEVWARWLRGNAKMEQINSDYNNFKAEWVSANGNPGQSRNDNNVLGMEVQKGESMNAAIKRYIAQQNPSNPPAAKQQQPAQQFQQPTRQKSDAGNYTSKSGIQFTVK